MMENKMTTTDRLDDDGRTGWLPPTQILDGVVERTVLTDDPRTQQSPKHDLRTSGSMLQ